MNIQQNNFSSIEQMTGKLLNQPNHQNTGHSVKDAQASFQEILQKRQSIGNETELKFSRHANERLASRNIDLSATQLERLENATVRAREKGINESLVMVDNLAFIVNVTNNTVITAVNDNEEKIFTNIDGAVII